MSLHTDDIEDLHIKTMERGETTYIDPATGYNVFTSEFHGKRGTCCGSACRHCPYGHVSVDEQWKNASVPNLYHYNNHYEHPPLHRERGTPLSERYWLIPCLGNDSITRQAIEHALMCADEETRLLVLAPMVPDGRRTCIDIDDVSKAGPAIPRAHLLTWARELGLDILLVPMPTQPTPERYTLRWKGSLWLYLQAHAISHISLPPAWSSQPLWQALCTLLPDVQVEST